MTSMAQAATRGQQAQRPPRKTRVSLPMVPIKQSSRYYKISSTTTPGQYYDVRKGEDGAWHCNCPARVPCKHAQYAAEIETKESAPVLLPTAADLAAIERPAGMAALAEAFHPDPLPPACSSVSVYAPSRDPRTALEQAREAIEASLSEVIRAERFHDAAGFERAVDAHAAALDAYSAVFQQALKEAGL